MTRRYRRKKKKKKVAKAEMQNLEETVQFRKRQKN